MIPFGCVVHHHTNFISTYLRTCLHIQTHIHSLAVLSSEHHPDLWLVYSMNDLMCGTGISSLSTALHVFNTVYLNIERKWGRNTLPVLSLWQRLGAHCYPGYHKRVRLGVGEHSEDGCFTWSRNHPSDSWYHDPLIISLVLKRYFKNLVHNGIASWMQPVTCLYYCYVYFTDATLSPILRHMVTKSLFAQSIHRHQTHMNTLVYTSKFTLPRWTLYQSRLKNAWPTLLTARLGHNEPPVSP